VKLSSANVWLGRRLAAVITFSLVLSNSQAVYSLLINLQQLLSLFRAGRATHTNLDSTTFKPSFDGRAMILLLFILV